MESRELRAIKNLRSIRRCNSYGDSVLAVYGVCYRGAFYDDLASVVATVKAQQARIEELEACAQLVIEELDVAALDDCESGVASVNAKLAGQYLNDYRHTREATYKLRGKAAKILEGTDDE